MNIFHKAAFQGLKKNKTRTLVTIVGVALSSALVTAVMTFAVSLLSYVTNGAIEKYGNWHIEFPDVSASFAEEQAGDGRVEHLAAFENIGYAALEGSKNPDKPYLFFAGFSKETFDTLPVSLISGRMPENSREVLVPAHVAANGGVQLSVGDTLTFSVGTRQAGEKTLCQHDTYSYSEETLVPETEKTYTVVGICQRPVFEERSAPGYTLITAAEDTESFEGSTSVFVTLKKPEQVYSYAESAGGERGYVLNDEVLRFMGISGDETFNVLLYTIGVIVIALVMLGSVFLIYNSFHISLNERVHEFGILMSVGATEKQLRNSVLFEGLCIGAVGVPLGILVGLPSIRLVLFLVAKNFANILYDNVPLTLVLSAPALAAAAVISFITILISAYLPAKKAARTPVMECIRQTNEIKVENKAVRTWGPAERIYGLEGTLALKNFKRNKGRYRSVILSLTLSVVLFVSTSSFVSDLKQVTGQADEVTDYDIGCSIQDMDDDEMFVLYDRMKTAEGVTKSACQSVVEFTCAVPADRLSDSYWEASGERPGDGMAELPMEVQFFDDAAYQEILESLSLPDGEYTGEKPKLLAVAKMDDESGQAESVSQLLDLFADSSVDITVMPNGNGKPDREQGKDISILCADFVPPDTPPYTGTYQERPYFFRVLAPWSLKEKLLPADALADVRVQGFTFQSDNPARSTSKMQAMLDEVSITASYNLYNVHEMFEQNRNLIFIVNLFAVIFIVMITLIAVANVFNTISTNIKLRRRELAMLRSVGMSDRDFNKMMCFECVFYGLRTLLFGLPLAGLFSWLIYRGIALDVERIRFVFPWASMAVSMLGVLLVIFITMLYAVSKIKKENIIDALRDDMT